MVVAVGGGRALAGPFKVVVALEQQEFWGYFCGEIARFFVWLETRMLCSGSVTSFFFQLLGDSRRERDGEGRGARG